MGRYVSVDVSVDDVISDLDTDDLVDELRERAESGDKEAQAVFNGAPLTGPKLNMSNWDHETLSEAVARQDSETAMRLFREGLQ